MSGSNELTTVETMSFLERASRDPTLDVEKISQLIALQERLLDREAKRQFAEAMNALQSEMTPISKDRTNPHTRSRYATYESIDAVLRPLYSKHGFSVQFTTHAKDGRIRVGCTVRHVGGHTESEHELESGPDMTGSRGQANKTEVQGVGSIVSYLKRYTLMAAFAVALQDDETDDDGGYRDDRPPPPPPPGQDQRRTGPPTNGGQPPAPPPPSEWDTWLDTVDVEARKLTADTWDAYWSTERMRKADAGLKTARLERLRGIQAREKARLFPEIAGNGTDKTEEATP